MKYTFSIKKNNNGFNTLIFPPKMKLIEYVFEDMESFGEPIFKNFIERVLNKISKYEEISGNICSLSINEDFTDIFVEFLPNGISNTYKIETRELLSLIEVWITINKL